MKEVELRKAIAINIPDWMHDYDKESGVSKKLYTTNEYRPPKVGEKYHILGRQNNNGAYIFTCTDEGSENCHVILSETKKICGKCSGKGCTSCNNEGNINVNPEPEPKLKGE